MDSSKGFASVALVVTLITLVVVGGVLLFQAKDEKFDEHDIIKSTEFRDSKNIEKAIVLAKTDDETVKAYLTSRNLSKKSAVDLSAASGVFYEPFALDDALITVSPDPGQKHFLITSQLGDGSAMVLFNEDGKLINSDIVADVYGLVRSECQCGVQFGGWRDQDEFYVDVATSVNDYEVILDANTGLVKGEPLPRQ